MLTICISTLSYAKTDQNNEPEKKHQKYFDTSIGLSNFYLRDKATSPVIYSGTNFFSTAGISFINKNMRHGINFRFNYGNLTPHIRPESVANTSKLENLGAEIDHFYLRKVYSLYDEKINFFTGLSANISGNMRDHSRFTNNSLSYDQANSLSINVQTEYDFTLFKRNFSAKLRSYIPIYTFIVRPSFASSTPIGFINQQSSDISAYFESGHHTSINNYFRWVNLFDLEYHLKNGNKLKLTYSWDYYAYKADYGVNAARHNILLGTMFNF